LSSCEEDIKPSDYNEKNVSIFGQLHLYKLSRTTQIFGINTIWNAFNGNVAYNFIFRAS